MGLQESSEQIPGQYIQKGEGSLKGCVPPSVDRLVGSVVRKTPAGLSGGTVNERLDAGISAHSQRDLLTRVSC